MIVRFMLANLTRRGTSLVQVLGTFGVPQKIQFCDRLFLSSTFLFIKTLLLEAPTTIPQVPSKPAVNARVDTQRARGKRHLHHVASENVAFFFRETCFKVAPKITLRRRRWHYLVQRRAMNKIMLAVCEIASEIVRFSFSGNVLQSDT